MAKGVRAIPLSSPLPHRRRAPRPPRPMLHTAEGDQLFRTSPIIRNKADSLDAGTSYFVTFATEKWMVRVSRGDIERLYAFVPLI
jgi:hypothetical protein